MPELLLVCYQQLTAQSILSCFKTKYKVDHFVTFKHGYRAGLLAKYSLIILDVDLPDISGYKLCECLRSEGVDAPILVITDKNSVRESICCLEAGADSYLSRPFGQRELELKVGNLLNRPPRNSARLLQLGEVEICRSDRTVNINGQTIDIRNKEFDILVILAERNGQLITREQLNKATTVWGKSTRSNVVDVYIGSLRRKLESVGMSHIIKTVHGLGYKLAL